MNRPVSAWSVQLLTELGAERGLAPIGCLRGSGLQPEILDDPLGEVTVAQEYAVTRNLLRHCGDDPGFVIEVGSRYHALMHGVLGLAWSTSRSLREALQIGLRYLDLTWAFTPITFTETDGVAVLEFDSSGVPADLGPYFVERNTAAIKTLIWDLLREGIPFRGVQYRHSAPADISRHVEWFGIAPTFDTGHDRLSVDAALLDLRPPQANEWVRRGYEMTCRELLEKRRARAGTAGAVRGLLVHDPGRIPDAAQVARDLALSPRTLARRLDEEGTSFRGLVDEVRETLAEELLCNAQMTTEQVARRLGYAESGNFVRAFKRWKGQTPQAYRMQSRAVRSVS